MNNLARNLLGVFIGLSIFAGSVLAFVPAYADVWVNGYYRSNGTYVQGHYRSSPDGNPYNNWSYPGNTNPYTGVTATGNPNTYLNNYYGSLGSSGSSYSSGYTSSYLSTPSCPSMSTYDSLSGSCKCYSGYVVKNGSCVLGNSVCHDEMGIMSSYDSLTKTCSCDYGYVLNSSGTCVYKSSTSYSTYSPTSYASAYSSLVSTCPANSHESSTDSTKCQCNSGYMVNAASTACIPVPVKTDDQMCAEANNNDANVIWDGTRTADGRGNCKCKIGTWNGSSCAIAQTQTASAGSALPDDAKQKLIAALQEQVKALLAQLAELQAKQAGNTN